jgi:hypothetical protein
VWVRAPDHVRLVDGVDYDQVATERQEPSRSRRSARYSGSVGLWGGAGEGARGRGPARGMLHAPELRRAHRCSMCSTR